MNNPCCEVTVAQCLYEDILKGGSVSIVQEGQSQVIEIRNNGWISIYRYHTSLCELTFCSHYWDNGVYERTH